VSDRDRATVDIRLGQVSPVSPAHASGSKCSSSRERGLLLLQFVSHGADPNVANASTVSVMVIGGVVMSHNYFNAPGETAISRTNI
jgi:hypothetical protein